MMGSIALSCFAISRTRNSALAAFRDLYAGHLAMQSASGLAEALKRYEAIEETLGRIMSYAQLLFSGDSSDATIARFYQSMSERVTDISTDLLFFSLELNRLDEAELAPKLADPALAPWASWLSDLRVFKPHQLSDEIEKLLHEKEVTGASAWSRLFDETMAGLRVSVGEERLTVSDALNACPTGIAKTRAAAASGISATFSENIRLFSLITNTLAKDKETMDRWRSYPSPGSYRNRSNMVEDEVVDALVAAVVASFPRLSHRYYTLKAGWLACPACSTGTATHRCRRMPMRRCHGPRLVAAFFQPMAPSARCWRRSASASSTAPGSTPGCGRASPAAPSPTRPCPPRIPISS